MSPLKHGLLVSLTVIFVFCVLAVLAPPPRRGELGDNKLYGAAVAAICAGVAVAVIL